MNPELANKCVLAVDDNEAHSYALCRLLSVAGFKVLPARTRAEAITLAGQKPDIILMDVNLPDGNGFEICERLRADGATANVPIIFMSASSQTSDAIAMAQKAGGDSYLFYPVEKEQLFAVMEGALRKRAEGPREFGHSNSES